MKTISEYLEVVFLYQEKVYKVLVSPTLISPQSPEHSSGHKSKTPVRVKSPFASVQNQVPHQHKDIRQSKQLGGRWRH